MRRTLLCVLIDTAAAQFMRPLIEEWIARPPAFDWHVAAGRHAERGLSELPGLPAHALTIVDPRNPAMPDLNSGAVSGLVVSAATWPAEFAAVRAARAAGLRSVQIVDTWYGYRRRFTEGEILVLPDRLLVVDETAAREAAAEGLPEALLAPVGNPHWEAVMPLPRTDSKDVLFLAAPVARDYGASLGYTERDCWLCLNEARRRRPDLFGRVSYAPHPTDEARHDLGDATRIRYKPAVLREIGTVVGMFSAPLVEAFLSGRRAITLQPNAKGHDMCPLSRHGRIPRTTSLTELIAALEGDPPNPAPLASRLAGSRVRVVTAIEGALAA